MYMEERGSQRTVGDPIITSTGNWWPIVAVPWMAPSPRYRFPPGLAKSEILFNFRRAAAADKPAVIVVEGFFDCFKLHQAAVRSVVALMGAALSTSQQRLLLDRFQHVILMLDGDAAGRMLRPRSLPGCSLTVQFRPFIWPRILSPTR